MDHVDPDVAAQDSALSTRIVEHENPLNPIYNHETFIMRRRLKKI